MANDFDVCMNDFFARLHDIKQKSAAMQLTYAAYQSYLRELHILQNDGDQALKGYLEQARVRKSFAVAAQIEETIQKWQKDIDELLKFLKRKAPRGC
nr:hypothetical protein [Candidatus Sigynarchaeota archaeon]